MGHVLIHNYLYIKYYDIYLIGVFIKYNNYISIIIINLMFND